MKGYEKSIKKIVSRESVWVQYVVTIEEMDEKILNVIPKGKSCEISFKSSWNFSNKFFGGHFKP